MNKIKYLLFLIVALFIANISVKAATITSSNYDGKFKIQGTGEGTIQIVIFDLNKNPIYMTTVAYESGKFSITLPEIQNLSEGNYTVKVADYDGSNSSTKVVKVEKANIPNTYDNIIIYIVTALISAFSIILLLFIIKGRKIKNIDCRHVKS